MPRRQRIRSSSVTFATLAQKQRILKTAFSPQAPRVSLQGESIIEVAPAPEDSKKITLSTENIADEKRIFDTEEKNGENSFLQ